MARSLQSELNSPQDDWKWIKQYCYIKYSNDSDYQKCLVQQSNAAYVEDYIKPAGGDSGSEDAGGDGATAGGDGATTGGDGAAANNSR